MFKMYSYDCSRTDCRVRTLNTQTRTIHSFLCYSWLHGRRVPIHVRMQSIINNLQCSSTTFLYHHTVLVPVKSLKSSSSTVDSCLSSSVVQLVSFIGVYMMYLYLCQPINRSIHLQANATNTSNLPLTLLNSIRTNYRERYHG